MHLFFIIFPWVEHLHQFEVPKVGILYNYAYPTVGNALLSKCKFPIDSGGGDGHACHSLRHYFLPENHVHLLQASQSTGSIWGICEA